MRKTLASMGGTSMPIETILIIDDEPSVRDIFIKFMVLGNYKAYGAASALEGLRLFELRQPDLIISDLLMPHIDGYEFCERIRQTSDVPIIIVTGYPQDRRARGRQRRGPDVILAKPVTMDQLLSTVEALLHQARSKAHRRVEGAQPASLSAANAKS
jgi:DNA-binding response OmpR family regulator